jgi:hypothetical protein
LPIFTPVAPVAPADPLLTPNSEESCTRAHAGAGNDSGTANSLGVKRPYG